MSIQKELITDPTVQLLVSLLVVILPLVQILVQCKGKNQQAAANPNATPAPSVAPAQQPPQISQITIKTAEPLPENPTKPAPVAAKELSIDTKDQASNQQKDTKDQNGNEQKPSANNNVLPDSKKTTEDSFYKTKPEVKMAKRKDEIEKKGPVSRDRPEYKTLENPKTTEIQSFDQSLGI